MKSILNILNSDSLNLLSSRFSVGALFLGLFDECIRGTPILMAHDASKLIGWSRPIALYFEPALTRLAGIGEMAEIAEDFELLQKFFRSRLLDMIKEFRDEFDELRGKLHGSLDGTEKSIYVESVAFVEDDLASRTFPDLFAKLDKDGLISLSQLSPIGPGVYQIGELLIFAHPHFRRSMYRLNSLNYPFLSTLQTLAHSVPKVAIDPHQVGLASTYNGGREELAYWWGPKFDNDLGAIPLGVSHHEADQTDRLFYGISATQFRWWRQNSFHVFEAEELPELQDPHSKDQYHCRYAHSMVVKEKGEVGHFDGSIRTYSDKMIKERLDLDLAHAGRNTTYTKLWRVDGQISIPTWKNLLTHYYRDNYLVGEYLGAEKPDTNLWGKDKLDTFFHEYAPYSIPSGSGIRLSLSIHPRSKAADTPIRLVQSFDHLTDGFNVHHYVETHTLELKKLLSRMGSNLKIPKGIRYVSFKDRYVNFPVIYHPGILTQQSVKETVSAIALIAEELQKRIKDLVISFNIAFPLEVKREARISVLGQADAVTQWLQNQLSCPPTTKDGLHGWSESVAEYLESSYDKIINTPHVFGLLEPTGILLSNRKQIDSKQIRLIPSEEKTQLSWEFIFTPDNKDTIEKLLGDGIQPAIAWLVEESKCTKCSKNYDACDCSKLMDKEVALEIVKATPFFFWTDRPL